MLGHGSCVCLRVPDCSGFQGSVRLLQQLTSNKKGAAQRQLCQAVQGFKVPRKKPAQATNSN